MTFCGNPSGVLMPVPTAVPPSGTSPTWGDRLHALDAEADLTA
jgi:hypothetical protein